MVAAQLVVDGLAMGLVFVILATGLVIITSVNKRLFMAYGMFYTIGAYMTWFATTSLGLPYLAAMLVGLVVSAVLGIICYLLLFQRLQRSEGGFLASLIASMGLLMVLSQGNTLIFGGQVRGIPGWLTGVVTFWGIRIGSAKLFIIAVGIVVTGLLFWVYEKTAVGRSMRAVAFLPEAASLQGIDSNRVFLGAMALGTSLAGFAGAVIAPVYGVNPQMGNNVLWTVMLMSMLGGMDSLLGALVGGVVIGQVLSFGQFYIGSLVQIIIFVLIGTVLYFRPNGLLGRGVDIGV
jgi:branched-chain amino acid transport system permease protein